MQEQLLSGSNCWNEIKKQIIKDSSSVIVTTALRKISRFYSLVFFYLSFK